MFVVARHVFRCFHLLICTKSLRSLKSIFSLRYPHADPMLLSHTLGSIGNRPKSTGFPQGSTSASFPTCRVAQILQPPTGLRHQENSVPVRPGIGHCIAQDLGSTPKEWCFHGGYGGLDQWGYPNSSLDGLNGKIPISMDDLTPFMGSQKIYNDHFMGFNGHYS